MLQRLTVLLALVTLTPATAGAAVLTSGSSELTVQDSDGIVTVWRTEPGGSDNVFLSSYYLRLEGQNGEDSFQDAFGDPVVSQPSPDRLSLSYSSGAIEGRLDYAIFGDLQPGRSTMQRSATITNLGTDILNFALFDYTDLDIRFDPTNQRDTAVLTQPGVIETTSASAPISIVTTVTPTPDQYQITDFLTLFLAFRADSDGATTLPNTPGLGEPFPTTPGDNAFAFGWEVSLAPGESFTASHSSTLTAIPLPATLPLLLTGLAGLAFARRRLRT